MLRDYQFPIAKALITGEYKYYIGALPRKSGKSLLGFYIGNALIIKNKDRIMHGLIIAKEKAQAKKIYEKNILDNGRPLFSILPSAAKYSPYDSEIKYSNGSTIEFNGSDNIETIRGLRFDFIICDEFATWKEDAFGALYPCLRDNNSVLMIYSTIRRKNHFWKKLQELKQNSLWITQHTNVIELGIMTQEEYDAIPLEANFKAQELMNDPDAGDTGAIYSKPNVTTENKFILGSPIYLGVDLGRMDDATAFVGAQVINGKIEVIFIEKYIGTVAGEVIASIKNKLKSLNIDLSQVKLFMPHDSMMRNELTGLSRMQHFQQEGFNSLKVPMKGVIDGIDLVRSLWHQINFYEKECAEGIEDIKSYTADENGKPDSSRTNHKFSHVPDALRYLCIGLEYYGIIEAWRHRVTCPQTEYVGMNKYKLFT